MAKSTYATLTANTVKTLTVDYAETLEVVSCDGAAVVWFTVDGADPVAAADGCQFLPASPSGLVVAAARDTYPGRCTVKLISSGTPLVGLRVIS